MARQCSLVLGCTFSLLLSSAVVSAIDSPQDNQTDQAKPKADVDKQTVLNWLDDYRDKQVLFHDDDLARLRAELADDTTDEAQRWWAKTEKIRAALESPEWKDTRKWLKEFLRVQAIYSDEEIEEFRTENKAAVREDSPKAFKEILADIEQRRQQLRQGSQGAQKMRESQLQVINAFRKEDAAARRDADRARLAAGPKAAENAVPKPVRSREPRFSRPPLVNSLDAARWGVMRNFWFY